MRRSFIVLALPVAWVGCFSSNSGGSGGASFDAGFDGAEFDSSVADGTAAEAGEDAPLEAKADGTSPPVDAAMQDASVQDVVSEPASPATVLVVGASGPEQGVPVVFQDGSGTLLGMTQTDANGKASQVVPAGSAMTALLGTVSSPALYTVLGVAPGESITVPDWGSFPSLLTAKLESVPTTPALTGVTQYDWFFGGGSPPGFPSVPWSRGLSTVPPSAGIGQFGATVGAALPSVVDAVNASGVVQGWGFAKDVPISQLDDAGLVEVAIGGSWSTTTTTQNVQIIQPDGGSVVSAGSYLSEGADGVLLPLFGGPYTTHPGFADFVQAEAEFGGVHQVIAVRAPAPTVSGTIGIDATPIPSAAHFTAASGSVSATGQPTLQWTLSQGTLAGMTGLVALTTWSATLPDGGGTVSGAWTLVAPGTAQSSVSPPPLPAAAAAYAPAPGATISVQALYAATGTAVPAYTDVVDMAAGVWAPSGCASWPVAPPLPVDGTALFYVFAPYLTGC